MRLIPNDTAINSIHIIEIKHFSTENLFFFISITLSFFTYPDNVYLLYHTLTKISNISDIF